MSSEIDRLDQVAADRYGLNRSDMRSLEIIGRAGPLSPTTLARLLGFTTGGVTTVIDRLEQAGYVHRRPDPADRRRLLIETTEKTTTRDLEVFGGLIKTTQDLIASYTDEDLSVILEFLQRAGECTATYADLLRSPM